MRARPICLLSMFLLGIAATAAAQDLERVKTLYVAAAYEEALAAMPSDVTGVLQTDLQQYRALCLLALGRDAEAIDAIGRLVKESPTYVPSKSDTSPRMRAIFDDVRAKLVPDVARKVYADAKEAFDARRTSAAQAGFKLTLEVIDSLPEADRQSLADLRMLAEGFLDLVAAASPLPPLPPPVADVVEKLVDAGEYAPPVALREQLPVWTPPDSAAMQTEFLGVVQINIAEDGTVSSASIVKTSHPMYDAAVMRAAKGWTYRPATRGGRPVSSQKNIHIRLVPR